MNAGALVGHVTTSLYRFFHFSTASAACNKSPASYNRRPGPQLCPGVVRLPSLLRLWFVTDVLSGSGTVVGGFDKEECSAELLQAARITGNCLKNVYQK